MSQNAVMLIPKGEKKNLPLISGEIKAAF